MHTMLRPGLVVTAAGPFVSAAVRSADYCEIRADLWPEGPVEALAHIAASPVPVIFTCRLPAEGGAFAGRDCDRAPLFAQAYARGAILVDIELRSALFRAALKAGWPVLASVHDFKGPIHNIDAYIRDAHAAGASAVKVVPTAHSLADVLTLRRILANPPLIPTALFAMGPSGIPSRILALTWGALLSYTGMETALAPGQLPFAAYLELYGSQRTFPRHIAIAGDAIDAHVAARLLNRVMLNRPESATAVPYPHATPPDFPAILTSLDALGVIAIERTHDNTWRSTAYGSGARPLAHAAGSLEETLTNAAGALL